MTIERLRSSAQWTRLCDNRAMSPTAEEVRAALERVLASDSFAGTSRLSRFLRFVVERSLAGDADRVKEYVIGVEVFDRDERYDPRVDSIVRVEAGRLRAKLDEYYRAAGADDPIAIRLEKGGYAPEFESRHGAPGVPAAAGDDVTRPSAPPSSAPLGRPALAPGAGVASRPRGGATVRRPAAVGAAIVALVVVAAAVLWRIESRVGRAEDGARTVVAVLPFGTYEGDAAARALALRLSDAITAELVRADRFAVVASSSARRFADASGDLIDIARALEADVLLEGRVVAQDGGKMEVNAMLIDPARQRKVWVDRVSGADVDELAAKIARDASAAQLAQRR